MELFDVMHDPNETRNLAAEQRERVIELTAALNKWWAADRR